MIYFLCLRRFHYIGNRTVHVHLLVVKYIKVQHRSVFDAEVMRHCLVCIVCLRSAVRSFSDAHESPRVMIPTVIYNCRLSLRKYLFLEHVLQLNHSCVSHTYVAKLLISLLHRNQPAATCLCQLQQRDGLKTLYPDRYSQFEVFLS